MIALPGFVVRSLQWLTAFLVLTFGVAALFVALVMPYRFWDSLAFGAWSRSIAQGEQLWTNASDVALQRPLFYVSQGLAWRALGEEEWIGRVLSLAFAAVLILAVWMIARRLTSDRAGTLVLSALAVGVVLASSVFAAYAAAGMSDVPVAAMVAATGAGLWRERSNVVLVTALAAGSVLAKPTALLALSGLAVVAFVLHGRRGARSAAAVGAGIVVALAYDLWQASRLGESLTDFLTAGNDGFWRERGAAARWDTLARADWYGEELRLIVLFGLAHAVARVARARDGAAMAIAAAVALVWSVAGPLVADGSVSYPFDGSPLGIAAWLVLAAAMVGAPFVAVDDPVGRRTYAALLVWLTPMAIVWIWQRADEARHLAPAWAPLVLLIAAALGSLSFALARFRPLAALAPAGAVAILAVANLTSIDGLGRDGWRELLELGPSGWSDRAAMENFAYGPFSYELNLARDNLGEHDRIVSSNGRLAYFFPGRVEIRYARTCSELAGARFFSYLTSGESLEFAKRESQPTEPLGWIQCEMPRVTLVGEQAGIYAAFVVGEPPVRAPRPEDCRVAPSAGQDVDAVFGDGLEYADAKALRERADSVGFQGVRIERTGCSMFRVVVTGVPNDLSVQTEFRREVRSVGLEVGFAEAVRYPEVPGDVPPVP